MATDKKSSFIDRLEYIGPVLDSEGLHTWGSSAVKGDDNLYHLFACQWPVNEKLRRWGFYKWDEESVVNRYTSPNPSGPYTFIETVIGSRPGGNVHGIWNRYSAHNPEIKRIGEHYVLTYISYPDIDDIPNAKIGMKIAKGPGGPWKDVGEKGMVLQKSPTPQLPSYESLRGTDNPSLIEFRGKYYLFFMFNPGPDDNTTLGVAVSDSLFGPYQEQDIPAFIPGKEKKVEDVCVFLNNGSLCAVMCDNFGIQTPNGGLYCEMDEEKFDESGVVSMNIHSIAYRTRPEMFPEQDFSQGTQVYGANKFERPKVMTLDSSPAFLFLPSGFNEKGGNRTVLHGFKIISP